MKGVSTVIATILMLMITIALAGVAYMYISGVVTTTAGGVIDIVDYYCNGTHAFVTIKNIGTQDIGTNSITITPVSTRASATSTTVFDAPLGVGKINTTFMPCTTPGNSYTCKYRLLPPAGKAFDLTVYCSG